MGVTVHFEGRLKTSNDYEKVIDIGRNLAMKKNAEIINLDSDYKKIHRVKDEKEWNYEGQVKGIQFLAHESSDPIVLEFDKDFYIQEFCKTQFAGTSTHIELIQLLRDIEPYFEELIVIDEGEFWETSDIRILEQKFEDYFNAADQAVQENPKLKGPFRLGDGRIVDLME